MDGVAFLAFGKTEASTVACESTSRANGRDNRDVQVWNGGQDRCGRMVEWRSTHKLFRQASRKFRWPATVQDKRIFRQEKGRDVRRGRATTRGLQWIVREAGISQWRHVPSNRNAQGNPTTVRHLLATVRNHAQWDSIERTSQAWSRIDYLRSKLRKL